MDQVLSLRFHSAVNEDIFGQIGATYVCPSIVPDSFEL